MEWVILRIYYGDLEKTIDNCSAYYSGNVDLNGFNAKRSGR